MTGLQEHPGTGRTLDHQPTGKVRFEELARSMGIKRVHVVDPTLDPPGFRGLVKECLDSGELALIVARRDCLLAAGKIKAYEKCEEKREPEQ
jgi:indolepyruvate ferredoxin oxidoreductase alpha subunit